MRQILLLVFCAFAYIYWQSKGRRYRPLGSVLDPRTQPQLSRRRLSESKAAGSCSDLSSVPSMQRLSELFVPCTYGIPEPQSETAGGPVRTPVVNESFSIRRKPLRATDHSSQVIGFLEAQYNDQILRDESLKATPSPDLFASGSPNEEDRTESQLDRNAVIPDNQTQSSFGPKSNIDDMELDNNTDAYPFMEQTSIARGRNSRSNGSIASSLDESSVVEVASTVSCQRCLTPREIYIHNPSFLSSGSSLITNDEKVSVGLDSEASRSVNFSLLRNDGRHSQLELLRGPNVFLGLAPTLAKPSLCKINTSFEVNKSGGDRNLYGATLPGTRDLYGMIRDIHPIAQSSRKRLRKKRKSEALTKLDRTNLQTLRSL